MLAGAEDLVPYLEDDNSSWKEKIYSSGDYTIKQYRPRIEGEFARIEKISHPNHGTYWKVATRDNVATIFGRTAEARIANPKDSNKIFQWLPEFSYDDKGNWIKYEYKKEDLSNVPNEVYENNRITGIAPFTNIYLKSIKYGNRIAYYADPTKPYDPQPPAADEHFFELVMDYGEHDNLNPTPQDNGQWDYRPDAFSSYRSGFEIRTNRLCKRILMFHHFDDEKQWDNSDFGTNYLVRSLDLEYEPSSINDSGQSETTYLKSITQNGYVRKPNGSYSKKSLPAMEFSYQHLNWNKSIKTVSPENIINAPVGLTNNYQWVDFYGEGISGILTEQGEGWFYKSNLGGIDNNGEVNFTVAEEVIKKPSLLGLSSGVLSLQDLASNGEKQIVVDSQGTQGYFELTHDQNWKPFKPFEKLANINMRDPNTRRIDLNGDGQSELVVTENDVFVWYESNGKRGYFPAEFAHKTFDEEQGPAIIFADIEETIFLADMSGDGLTDIVRIRNGEICYWANMGYGKFSAKVNMGNAPLFDHDDKFNPQYLHLADVSGTGATDILYLGTNQFKAFINLSGNSWSNAHLIDPFLPIDSNTKLSVVDLLGSGTTCIVWSSDLPEYGNAPMKFIDLMNSKKPHVMSHFKNNMGKETTLEYKSSTYFYLKDKLEGTPWITKLPFAVQVVSKQIVEEKITNVRFTSEFHYHHGYYDHPEREFRGFGRVDQIDSETYEEWQKNNAGNQLEKNETLYQKPVLTKTWFHTGAFLDRERILTHFKEEYWHEVYNRKFPLESLNVSEPALPDAHLSDAVKSLHGDEYREAFRACKGMMLRQEIFALDAEDDSADALKLQMKPYLVTTHNCNIQLIQRKAFNPYGVFLVTESEALTFSCERDETDYRLVHSINTQFDELGNVLENVSVVYGRDETKAVTYFQDLKNRVTDFSEHSNQQAQLASAFHDAMEKAQAEQTTHHIIITKSQLTNDMISDNNYRLRLPAEVKTFEVTGLSPTDSIFSLDEVSDIINLGTEIAYPDKSTNGLQHRCIEHVRNLYLSDDLENPNPIFQLSANGLPYESYQLAFTSGLLKDIYGNKLPDADHDIIMSEGKYHKWDGKWWIRSGTIQYVDAGLGENVDTAKNRFFSPMAYTDPFGSDTKVTYYKDYFLFIQSTEDALQHKSSIEAFNFRTLAASLTRDLNDNLSEIIQDELGLVKAMALLGKDTTNNNIADSQLADNLVGYTEYTDNETQEISSYLSEHNSNALHTLGKTLLKKASARFVYDFNAYFTSGKPTVVSSIVREEHHADNPDSKLQLAFEYSNGNGQVVMTKSQAEPGLAKQLIIQADGSFQINEMNTAPLMRWIGNGRTVLNNKGNPVKQYEPYFSISPKFENAPELVETGVTPILYYDALDRLIKTSFPDGTFSRVVFDSWHLQSFDQNDTVLDSTWYQDRITGQMGPEKQEAAQKTESHYHTPSTIILDSLARPILSFEHNGVDANTKEKLYATLIELDIEGNAKTITDARGNNLMQYKYDMLGHRLYENSSDKGEAWMLNNAMGSPVQQWDNRNHVHHFTYDQLQRPLTSKVTGGETQLLNHAYSRSIYAENTVVNKLKNLCGQLAILYDTAGKMETVSIDIKGATLESYRQLATDYKNVVNWDGANDDAKLDPDQYTTKYTYDALGRVIQNITPDDSITIPVYNEANLLEKVSVDMTNSSGMGVREQIDIVRNIDYNEKGQRTRIQFGNGATTKYHYEETTFRLKQLITAKAGGEKLQDLHYTYDPIGNIAQINDLAIPTVFHNNAVVEGKSKYSYDALYRLMEASGREMKATAIHGAQDKWKDLPFIKTYSANNNLELQNYRQHYVYDPVGNIDQMRHIATQGSWTRNYTYETNNNRLISTSVGNNTYNYPHHPVGGFITQLPHLQRMHWNFLEELQATSRQHTQNATPEMTYYVYDGTSERIRKVTELQNGHTKKEERVYLGGIEIYKKHSGNHSGLERITLHVYDDESRIAMIDTRNGVNDNTDERTLRFQFGNHLGSVSLEMNETAQVIAYEEYHPYGTTAYQAKNQNIKAAAKRYKYTGMERDEETGLSYHSARYYLPWLGRWLSGDPIGVEGNINIFAYIQNPVSNFDSNGLSPKKGDFISGNEEEILINLEKKYKVEEGSLAFYVNSKNQRDQRQLKQLVGKTFEIGDYKYTYLATEIVQKDGINFTLFHHFKKEAKPKEEKWYHTVLDFVGMIPVIGEAADLINAGIYAWEGDWKNVALSASSAIPIAGNAVAGAKLTNKARKVAQEGTQQVTKHADEAVKATGSTLRKKTDDIDTGLNDRLIPPHELLTRKVTVPKNGRGVKKSDRKWAKEKFEGEGPVDVAHVTPHVFTKPGDTVLIRPQARSVNRAEGASIARAAKKRREYNMKDPIVRLPVRPKTKYKKKQ